MKNNRSKQRRGFTLVELLIVIVVIGVLSAMMMLSSTEAVSSARASNIVSNLRNLKTAALAWYADHLDIAEASDFEFTESGTGDNKIKFAQVIKYMNNESSGSSFTGYKIYGSANKDWYVVYEGSLDTRVSEKLEGRASSVGLVTYTESAGTGGTTISTYKKQDSGSTFNVGMKVLEHNEANDSNNNQQQQQGGNS